MPLQPPTTPDAKSTAIEYSSPAAAAISVGRSDALPSLTTRPLLVFRCVAAASLEAQARAGSNLTCIWSFNNPPTHAARSADVAQLYSRLFTTSTA